MNAHKLISRCKAGDRQALHLLYQQYRSRLLNICREYTKGEDVAEDLLHDAFVVILTSLDKLRDADKLESWMISIVRNVGFHYREHQNKEQEALQQIVSEELVIEETTLMPDYDQLRSLVTQLPEGYQQVFRLSVFEGLSHQEISQLLGIAPHSSSSQLSHAKRMLQALIKQSWVFVLLLIAIPAVVWKLLQKQDPETKPMSVTPKPHEPRPALVIETPHDEPVYASAKKSSSSHTFSYQTEVIIQPDSIPYIHFEKPGDDSLETVKMIEDKENGVEPKDSTVLITKIPQTIPGEPRDVANIKSEPSGTWGIRLAYNGQIGQRDDYLAATTIGKGSFDAFSNSQIPTEHKFDNWAGYNYYLNSPYVSDDLETRSLRNIAFQNSFINGGQMEARYEHQLPLTIQVLLSRQFSKRLSFETGISYTRLSSTVNTGSSQAYIQERQRHHYLGVPLRLGWQWYNKAHFSLYSSAGLMLELPISNTSDINHIDNGRTTYHIESTYSVPCQWSTTLGLGLQYDLMPHLGIYLEPSLQYFFNDGSDMKTYRTEHPFSITLPLGIRFRW